MDDLVDELVAAGRLRTPAWISALRAVPRTAFVPYYFQRGTAGWRLVEPPDPAWRPTVESGRVAVTQVGGSDDNVEEARNGPVRGDSTSSSSEVPLMVEMLEALDIAPEHRILEIGTGTGYNAALLAHGHASVTSVDVDAALVARAEARLAGLGLHARLVVGDGMRGCPGAAPFDRVIATVGCPRVPRAWIEQCAPGARILLPLDLAGSGGLMPLLTVVDGVAQGRFLKLRGSFMSIRAGRRDVAAMLRTASAADGPVRATALPVVAVRSMSHFEFFAVLRTGGHVALTTPGSAETWLVGPNGSWARHVGTDDVGMVSQGGPDALWDRIEEAHRTWTDLGRPPRERFGLTVDGGQHTIWLDEPAGPHRWPLPVR